MVVDEGDSYPFAAHCELLKLKYITAFLIYSVEYSCGQGLLFRIHKVLNAQRKVEMCLGSLLAFTCMY